MNQRPISDTFVRADAQTAFILGNGPSLAEVSLPSLNEFATIGLNAAYRYWRKIDWRPRYYACVDLVVGLSHKDQIAELIEEGRIEKFLLRTNLIEALGKTARTDRVVNFDVHHGRGSLLSAIPPTTGSHAALWAGEMGYRQIVMLGVDARYKEFVEGSAKRDGIELEIVEARDNPNYFFEGYQAPGDRYNIPNPRPSLHVNAWRNAIAQLENAGVAVFNANPQSAVRCAPYVSLDRFLADGDAPQPRDERLRSVENQTDLAMLAAAQTVSHRLKAFLGRYGAFVLTATVLAGGALAGWIAALKPPAAVIWPAVIATAFILSAGLVLLYVRDAILAHMQRLDRDISVLRAWIADLERRR